MNPPRAHFPAAVAAGGSDWPSRAGGSRSGHTRELWPWHFPPALFAGGASLRHTSGRAQLFWKWPFIRTAALQLSGTMTEDDGFCYRGRIRQTPRWEKGARFFLSRSRKNSSCAPHFPPELTKLLSFSIRQWRTRWLVLRKPSPVAGKKSLKFTGLFSSI